MPSLTAHHPRVVTVYCDDCGEPRPTTAFACSRCRGESITDSPRAVCATDEQPWPCTSARADADRAVLAWAAGDDGFRAAAEILLRSALRHKMVPTYLRWSPWSPYAYPDWDALGDAVAAGDDYLSSSELTLLRLCANLAHGSVDAGANLNLQGLWSFDPHHRRVVLDALVKVLV